MDVWLSFSSTTQAVWLFILGAVIAGQVNRGIYRLAYEPRFIGPWSSPAAGTPARRWFDRLPIVGWLSLRREAGVWGPGFWLRPFVIEIVLPAGLVALYFHELGGGLLPVRSSSPAPEVEVYLAQFFGHAMLITLMTIATFIDFDEQTIPDAITLPGTLAGLVISTALPVGGLPVWTRIEGTQEVVASSLRLTSPNPWTADLDGVNGLAIGVACFAAWCYALIPKRWIGRRGLVKGCRYFCVGMWRSGWCGPMAALALAGSLGILGGWWLSGPWWRSLLTSLVGMAAGGMLVWGFRLVFGIILGEEAMGFGDVTLMAMVGSFLGWQATVIAFFLAPFAAVFIAVGQWLLTRRRDIAFGPYLCLATGLLIVRWGKLWNDSLVGLFSMGWLIPIVVAICVAIMGPLLLGMRWLRGA